MTPEQTPFTAGWWGTDLGRYRACDGTYCFFEYDSLPAIDETMLRGDFSWLAPLTDSTQATLSPHQERQAEAQASMQAKLAHLTQALATVNLALPPEFVRFMSQVDWQALIPSCTANYFLLPDELVPSPFGDGGYCINFLNDQQEVLLWYIYLAPNGEHCIIVTPFDIADHADQIPAQQAAYQAHVRFCASSLEAFLYRYWLENTIWFSFDEAGTLTPAQEAYLQHYELQ